MSGEALAIVYTLYGDPDEARRAVSDVVQAGLAACGNILSPSESYYMWNGLFERQREYPVLFKTSPARRDALVARLGETHPYDVPAILSWDADSAPGYARWVEDMTRQG
ncbi:MAG: divalent-cation tolerance protein CutA [Sphingobium sp.]